MGSRACSSAILTICNQRHLLVSISRMIRRKAPIGPSFCADQQEYFPKFDGQNRSKFQELIREMSSSAPGNLTEYHKNISRSQLTYVGGLIYRETVCLVMSSQIQSPLKITHRSQRGCGSRLTIREQGDGNAVYGYLASHYKLNSTAVHCRKGTTEWHKVL